MWTVCLMISCDSTVSYLFMYVVSFGEWRLIVFQATGKKMNPSQEIISEVIIG